MPIILNDFNSFHVSYGITNPLGKDLARIEFFKHGTRVGQALFGSAVAPGSYAAIEADGVIDLYLPMNHFPNILTLLQSDKTLALTVRTTAGPGGESEVTEGGISAE